VTNTVSTDTTWEDLHTRSLLQACRACARHLHLTQGAGSACLQRASRLVPVEKLSIPSFGIDCARLIVGIAARTRLTIRLARFAQMHLDCVSELVDGAREGWRRVGARRLSMRAESRQINVRYDSGINHGQVKDRGSRIEIISQTRHPVL
jgi:hypothetical protein